MGFFSKIKNVFAKNSEKTERGDYNINEGNLL